jgi:exonuclease VII large subunit
VLADLIAATSPPTPSPDHSWYDWLSDIVLPTVVGIGSLAIAAAAVFVARKSNRHAAAATKAADRSNALARRAILHDEQRAEEADRRNERSERDVYVNRVLASLDLLAEHLENGDEDQATRAHSAVAVLQMEAVARGYSSAPTGSAVDWLIEANGEHPLSREDAFLVARQAFRALLTEWARDPEDNRATELVLAGIFHHRLAGSSPPEPTD